MMLAKDFTTKRVAMYELLKYDKLELVKIIMKLSIKIERGEK